MLPMFSFNTINYPDDSLFKVIEKNEIKELENHLRDGKDINQSYDLPGSVEGETLFHAAARLDRPECLKILLKYNSNTSILEQVAIYNHKKTLQILTPIQVAIQKQHKICEQLLKSYNQLSEKKQPVLKHKPFAF